MLSEYVESIELITNPSAKYDTEGSGGKINLVMKNDLSTGFNGSINAGYAKGEKPRTNLGTSLNSSGKKLNLLSSINYSNDN